MKSGDLQYVQRLVREGSANVLADEKAYLVDLRLTPVRKRHGFESLETMIGHLRGSKHYDLHDEVVEALTINESYFFRDATPFQLLVDRAIPELIERRRSERKLDIWSAACSTGQEPYSIAMVLLEKFPALKSWNVRVHASDLNRATIAHAKEGVYARHEINRGLPPEYLDKYFEPCGDRWRVRDAVRRLVSFRQVNLAGPWPLLPTMDVIFLRNVMIYFDLQTKRRVLGCAERQLQSDGFLFVGGAESPVLIYDGFSPETNQSAGCFRVRAREGMRASA